MKITIEPSLSHETDSYHTVTIETPHDDVAMEETMEMIVKSLQGWGYANETISSYLDKEFAHSLGLEIGTTSEVDVEAIFRDAASQCCPVGVKGTRGERGILEDNTSEYGGV